MAVTIDGTNGIDLGNTDTTLARVSAGVLSVEGNHVPSPASQAQGDILYHDGTTWARLGAGTSGNYLKTNGTGANPAWAAVTSGGLTSLGSVATTSGSSVSLGSLTLTTYKALLIVLIGVDTDASASILIGNSTSDDVSVTLSFTNTNVASGLIFIDLTDGIGASAATGSNPAIIGTSFDTPLSTSTTSISFAMSAGSFTAGSIRVYGLS